MGEVKLCPMASARGKLLEVICARHECAWWDEKQTRCRAAGGSAELERLVAMVGAFIEDEWEPVTRVVGDVGNGLMVVGKELDRLSETMKGKEV
ncbi:hypothetical protein ES708_14730 [subsurface metagenome]